MNPIEVLGLVAGALTTTAYLPQAVRTLRSGSARDLSLAMLLLTLPILWVKLRRG